MTILQVVRDVCAVVGVTVPTSVFASIQGNRTMQEMSALANETAQRIAYDTREWTMLRTNVTIVGDGVAVKYPLPADYKRMLLTANVWRKLSPSQPLAFVPDHDEWIQRRLLNTTNGCGEWIINDGHIYIYPYLPAGDEIIFAYLDKNCIALASGGYGDRFVNDADSYRLDERLLKLNMIWQWKAQKGSPFAEDMGTYSDALANASGADKPSPILIDRLPASSYARVGAPWPVDWGP